MTRIRSPERQVHPRKKWRERGRPLVDRRIEYSEDHRYLLAFCAEKANYVIETCYGYRVPAPELMAEGWWKCLRRLKVGELNRATDRMIRDMVRYGRDYHWEFYAYPWTNEEHRSTDAEQAIPATSDPFAAVDAADELNELLAGMDRTLVRIGMYRYGWGLPWKEIGPKFHRTGEWARQRGLEFSRQVRQRLAERGQAVATDLLS